MKSILNLIDSKELDMFKSYCLANLNKESCALIYKQNNNLLINICDNVSFKPQKYFEISNSDYIKVSRKGEIVGLIHSHITNKQFKFSILDKTIAEGHNINSIIYNVKTDTFHEYVPTGNFKNEYVGRDFKWGQSDCFSLVADYYNKEINIDINVITKNRDRSIFISDYVKNKEYIKDAYKYGFRILSNNNELEENDILFMKDNDSSYPSHLGIYLGNNKILHQPRNQKSLIETINSSIFDRIVYIFRRNNE